MNVISSGKIFLSPFSISLTGYWQQDQLTIDLQAQQLVVDGATEALKTVEHNTKKKLAGGGKG